MSVDWERATALFGAARALGATERHAFLEAACATDLPLRAEVEALLDGDADDDFLERPPRTAIVAALDDTAGTLSPGQILNDRYCIDGVVGAGGQALVYRATDRVLSCAVVVKVMRGAHRHREHLAAHFMREMHALSQIDHPGVVGILDVGTLDDGSPFLVIQHVDGVCLRELLESGPLDPHRTAGIVRQLGAALGAAHAADVAHRDVKPANVLVQRLRDGRDMVTLIDFGIAKVMRSHTGAGMSTIMVAGTVRYMAPEQFEGEGSPASDVYALALVACEMLCGEPDIRVARTRVSAPARLLLERALDERPERRPRDIAGWSEQLARRLLRTAVPVRRVAALGAAVPLVAAALVGMHLVPGSHGEAVRVIQKVGAFDPLDEGFLAHNRVTGAVAQNPDWTIYEAWRTFASGPGDYYYKHLTPAQKRQAMDRGWTLSTVMRLEEGMVYAAVDLLGYGKRFDVVVQREPDDVLVRLYTQIVPAFQGIDVRMPREPDAYHHFELRYDSRRQAAELWIDGTRRLEHYRGHTQFQEEGIGLFFGAGPYRSERGVGSFRSVRLELHP